MRHFGEAILNPYFILLSLFALLLLGLFRIDGHRKLKLSFMFLWIGFVFLSQGWLAAYLTAKLENTFPSIEKVNTNIHWVVVLSGGQAYVKNYQPHVLLYGASIKRLLEGVRLYSQLPAAKLVLSGGGARQEMPEAKHLAQLCDWLRIPSQDLVLEIKSYNTRSEAEEVKNIVGSDPFYLVTSAIHMPRAMNLFKAQNLNPIAAPTDYTLFWFDERWEKRWIPNPYNLVYLSIVWHETLGRLAASAKF